MSSFYRKECPIHGEKRREDDGDHYFYVCDGCADPFDTAGISKEKLNEFLFNSAVRTVNHGNS